MTKTIEPTTEEQTAALTFWGRIALFRKEMTLKEIRLAKKCQEDSNDVNGIMAGILWVHRQRADKTATFDEVMNLTEGALLEELEAVLPTS